MRILTIRPPWAQAIFHGKDVENRKWSTDYRGPVAIHAGLRFDNDAWDLPALADWMSTYWGMTRDTFTGEAFRGGAIIGVVDLNRICVNARHMELVTAAENSRRVKRRWTHCVHGHEFTPENTYWRAEGRRMCRACSRERKQRSS